MEKEGKELQNVIRMKGGLDEESYADNSKSQSAYLSKTVPVLVESVLDLCETNLPEQLNISDVGCSSGPNTLFPVSEITSIAYRRCCEVGRPGPDFCLFFNDLPGNDFNTVFRSLSAFQEKMTADNGPGFGPVYVYGVPGSFYGRHFPSNSLHLVHSGSNLHWLSQGPPELTVKTCPLINKGKIFISKTSSPAVVKAYASQFQRDFSSFLKARSKEVVTGGRMVLMFRGRRLEDSSPDESCLLWNYLGQAFQDLVSEGLIEQEKLDTYNTPYCEPFIEESKAEVEKEGSFTVDSLMPIIIPWDGCNGEVKCDRATTARNMGKAIRVVNESMIRSHFGAEIMDRLFDKFSENVAIDTKKWNMSF